MPKARAWRMIAALAVLAPHAAQASLGGAAASIGPDFATMQVRQHAVTPSAAGTLHTLTLVNGGQVREYLNAAGMVYAIRWNAPGKPDLQSLLGDQFATLQADNLIASRHGLRRAPSVNRTNLRVVTGGRPGAFWGYAWLPQNAPSGFNPASL